MSVVPLEGRVVSLGVVASVTSLALIVEAVIGLGAGILTGLRGRGFLDNLVLVSTLLVISLPVFVIRHLHRHRAGTAHERVHRLAQLGRKDSAAAVTGVRRFAHRAQAKLYRTPAPR